ARLERFLGETKQVRYFVDAASLRTYDLLARSAIVRVMLANRSRFQNILLLNWDESGRSAATSPLTALGDLLQVILDPADFQARLLKAAPFATHRLNLRHEPPPTPAPLTRTR
ncbi:MAG TPA: hypothetical protein VGK73_05395, partial [Polyangiaceae bacterium]